MKQRSLENQYRMLDALKARFDAVEVPVRLSGWGRAQELAALATELTEGGLFLPGVRVAPELPGPGVPPAGRPGKAHGRPPSVNSVVQTQLFEEAA